MTPAVPTDSGGVGGGWRDVQSPLQGFVEGGQPPPPDSPRDNSLWRENPQDTRKSPKTWVEDEGPKRSKCLPAALPGCGSAVLPPSFWAQTGSAPERLQKRVLPACRPPSRAKLGPQGPPRHGQGPGGAEHLDPGRAVGSSVRRQCHWHKELEAPVPGF